MHVLQTRKPRLSSARLCDVAELTDVRLLLGCSARRLPLRPWIALVGSQLKLESFTLLQ